VLELRRVVGAVGRGGAGVGGVSMFGPGRVDPTAAAITLDSSPRIC
jgi:hypothetical protein